MPYLSFQSQGIFIPHFIIFNPYLYSPFLRKGLGGKLLPAMSTGFLPFTFQCYTCDLICKIFYITYLVSSWEPVTIYINCRGSRYFQFLKWPIVYFGETPLF
jgi:hypothetical protein